MHLPEKCCTIEMVYHRNRKGDDIEIQELASELENEFGIEFSEEIGSDITVSELAERVERDS